MFSKKGFEFQNTDLELLSYTYQLRLATVDHLSALSGRSVRALWGRLLKLKRSRYLSSPTRSMQKRVYGLGSQGVAALIDAGYAPQELASKRLRNNELTELGIRHATFIADIHTRLLLLTRDGSAKLSHWQEGSPLWDTVPGENGEPTIPVRPDAYFVLSYGSQGQTHVFLEADRSTMAHTRMIGKIKAYLTYHALRQYKRKYPGMPSFVVATVTQTKARADELRRDLLPLIPLAARHAYPFIPFEGLALPLLLASAQ